ncbi:hypothetical protein CSIM01_02759 [Colletotrichum simmondsii]|uniref:Uncharacterized protein n=1 Tax=Colletotrichum simmondsii TaxID=703756 RepID=A0A135T193_9PEZI|nr:hypothetical protein CSIM01_02759 [Colletotrichum simmondsii]
MANDKKVERQWQMSDGPAHTAFPGLKGPTTGTSLLSTTAQRSLLKHEPIRGYENENVPAGKTYHGLPLDGERVVRTSRGMACTTAYATCQFGAAKLLLRTTTDLDSPVELFIKSMVMSGIRLLITYSEHHITVAVRAWYWSEPPRLNQRCAGK